MTTYHTFDVDSAPAPSPFDPVHLPIRTRRDIIIKLLANMPSWLIMTPEAYKQMAKALTQLECDSGEYRAYATYNTRREVTGFVFRSYYGGIWFPAPIEAKIVDIEV